MNSRVGPRLTELFSSHQYLRLLFAEYTQCLPLSLFSTAVASQHVSTPDNPFIQLSSHSELKLFALINWRGSREAQGLETTDGLRCGADVTAHCILHCTAAPPRAEQPCCSAYSRYSTILFDFPSSLSSSLYLPSNFHLQLISILKKRRKDQ